MAGNKKPTKKYNPNKPMPVHRPHGLKGDKVTGMTAEHRARIHQPIDMAIHKLGGGAASVVDFHNVLYRALVGKMMAEKFCIPEDQSFFKQTYELVLKIKERNETTLDDPRRHIWSCTAEEYAQLLEMHSLVVEMHDQIHRKHFVTTYKHVNDVTLKMIKVFQDKFPARVKKDTGEVIPM